MKYALRRRTHEIQTAVESEEGEVAYYVRGARDLPCFA